MHDLIPFIAEEEHKKEVKWRDVSVIFDGTTRLNKALAVFIRFIDDGWEIVQRLVRV